MHRFLLIIALLALARCNCSDQAKRCAGIDLQLAAQNCGTCGHACLAGEVCTAGACVDPCAGKNLQTDPQNCGACSHACLASEVCAAGACVDPCAGKSLQTDPQNCGTCSHACPAGDTCVIGTCTRPPPPLTVAISSPADGALVGRQTQVTVNVIATGTLDSLRLTAKPGPTIDVIAGVPATLDLSAVASGTPVTLTARAVQGARTADATPVQVYVIVRDVTPLFVGLSGYYLVNELVPLNLTVPDGATKVQFKAGETVLATVMGPPFQAVVRASQLGTGDVTVTAVASDDLGNTNSGTASLTVGLLHGSSASAGNPAHPLTDVLVLQNFQDAKSVLWAANRVANVGELRWTATKGGQEATLHEAACFTGSGTDALDTFTGVMASDGSSLAFPAATAGGACTRLEYVRFPPSKPVVELSTAYVPGSAVLSFEGSGIVFLENNGGSLRLMGGYPPNLAPAPLAVGPITQPRVTVYPLSFGAFLINIPDSNNQPGAVSYRLTTSGLEVLKTEAGANLPLPLYLPATYNESALDPAGSIAGGLSSSLTSANGDAILFNTPGGLFSVTWEAGTKATNLCAPSTCTHLWRYRNAVTFDRSTTQGALDNSGWRYIRFFASQGILTAAPVGSTSFQIPGSSKPFNPLLPRDNSLEAYLFGSGAGPFSVGLVAAGDYLNYYTLVGGLDASVGLSFFNWMAEGVAGRTLGPRSGGFINVSQTQTFFDDPKHALLFDSSHLYGVTADPIQGGAPPTAVKLDDQTTPFHYASNDSVSLTALTFDHQHAYYQATNGNLVSWAMGGAAPVQLGSGPVLLPAGYNRWKIDSAGDELSSQTAIFLRADGSVATQSWDGGNLGVLSLAGQEANTTARRFGLTTDGVAWWAGADGHLRVVPPVLGTQTIDFGIVDAAGEVLALAGGAFVFPQGAALKFASVAAPAPVSIGQGAGPAAIAVGDDWSFALLQDGAGATFLVSAAGVVAMTAAGSQFMADPVVGTASARGPAGSLWLASLRAGAPLPVRSEGAGVSLVARAAGHVLPRVTKLAVVPEQTRTGSASFRWAPVYVKSGGQQPGIYVWDVTYGLGR